MTKRLLRRWATAISLFWCGALVVGLFLRWRFPGPESWYGTFKDMIPLIVAVPAAWLGFFFQRRHSYLQQLRILWSTLVRTVGSARMYALDPAADEEMWRATLRELSIAIDEVRGVFRNAGESRTNVGLYPFESLKEIYELVDGAPPQVERLVDLADEIDQKWRRLRAFVLHEFDRECPEHLDSPYIDLHASNLPLKLSVGRRRPPAA
jgi:hypothetical protein